MKNTATALAFAGEPRRLLPLLLGPYLLLHWYLPVGQFTDSAGYLTLLDHSPLSGQFWRDLFGWRPITAVLFFGLLKDPHAIKLSQAVISFSAWAYFAFQFSRLLPETRRPIAFAALFAGVLGSDVMLWNRALMSESLSLSLFVAFLGGLAWILRDGPSRPWPASASIALLIFLTAQARDANLLLVVAAVPIFAFVALRHADRGRRVVGVVAIGAIVAAAATQVMSARENARHVPPLLNAIGQRVLVSDERTAFFVAAGMPISSATECLRGRWYYDCSGPDMAPLEQWARTDGPRVYAAFLLSRPFETVTKPFFHKAAHRLTELHEQYWFPDRRCHGTCDEGSYRAFLIASAFSVWNAPTRPVRFAVLAAVAIMLAIAVRRLRRWRARGALGPKNKAALSLAVYALAVGFAGVIATYHADAMEFSRHMLGYALLFRLGCLMLILMAVRGMPLSWLRPRAIAATPGSASGA